MGIAEKSGAGPLGGRATDLDEAPAGDSSVGEGEGSK